MQGLAETARVLSPADVGVVIIAIVILGDRVMGWVSKLSGNGKPVKDETKEYKVLHQCKDDPRFNTHVVETHEALMTISRCEDDHKGMSKGINMLVAEARVHTKLLDMIAKNGKMK